MQRASRLRTNADFRRVRARGRSWAHPLLVLYTAPNEIESTRIGISVSRRVGKAVMRNRVRRRIREAVRPLLADLAVGRDLLFIARPPAATADWSRLGGAVLELLRRASLLAPTHSSTGGPS